MCLLICVLLVAHLLRDVMAEQRCYFRSSFADLGAPPGTFPSSVQQNKNLH